MEKLHKGHVKSDSVDCAGPGCNKKISKLSSVPVSNMVTDKKTGNKKELSVKKWLCDDCFKKQTEKVSKIEEPPKPPSDVNTVMSRHRNLIPTDHPDRKIMVNHINALHAAGNELEARRMYDRYISGGGQFSRDKLSKSGIEIESFSDGTVDIVFNEEVSEVLEKAITLYMSSIGYEEILDKGLKAKHKSKKGGMTEAGVKAYRRENPGSKLQTAVTEKKPKGKRAKRRKSFCARMSGAKGPMKDEKGRPTRKALALRRWRC